MADWRIMHMCMLCMDVYIYIHTHTHTHTHTRESPTHTCKQENVALQRSIALKKMTQWISASERTEKRSENMREMRVYYGWPSYVWNRKKCGFITMHGRRQEVWTLIATCMCVSVYVHIRVHLPFRAGRAAMTNDQYFLSTLLSVRIIAPLSFFSFSFLSI
jgi:hypothetical protein